MLILLKHANDGGTAGPSLPGCWFPPLFTQTAPVTFDTRRRRREETEEDDENREEREKGQKILRVTRLDEGSGF